MSAPSAFSGSTRRCRHLLGLAQLGHAHWFFGNLYEAIVRVPDRLASHGGGAQRAMSPLQPGSPVRYYAAAAPATFPALLAAVVMDWDDRSIRRWVGAAAACSITGAGMTSYLVRAVNMKLFFNTRSLTEDERNNLLRTWYRLNAVRLALIGGA